MAFARSTTCAHALRNMCNCHMQVTLMDAAQQAIQGLPGEDGPRPCMCEGGRLMAAYVPSTSPGLKTSTQCGASPDLQGRQPYLLPHTQAQLERQNRMRGI